MSPASASCSTRCGSGVVGGASRAALTSIAGLLTGAWSARRPTGPGPRVRWGASRRAGTGGRRAPPARPARTPRRPRAGPRGRSTRRRRFGLSSATSAGAASASSSCATVQQVVAQLGQAGRDHVHRGRGHDEQAEEPQHQQDRHGAVDRHRGLERAGGQEPDDAATVAHALGALGRGGDAGRDVGQARGGEGEGAEADADAGVGRVLLRRAQEADAEEEQGERHGVRDASEGAGDDGVHDVAERALEGPPLAGGHEDRQPDQEEAEAVAAVLGLELAGAGADAADRATGHVGHAHPGAPDRAQGQRQPAALGPCRGQGPCGVRCSCGSRGGWRCPGTRMSARRWTDVWPWSAGYAKVTPETRVTRVSPRGNLRPAGLIRTVYIWPRSGRRTPFPLTKGRPQVTRSALRLAGPAPTTSNGRRRRRASRGNRSRARPCRPPARPRRSRSASRVRLPRPRLR